MIIEPLYSEDYSDFEEDGSILSLYGGDIELIKSAMSQLQGVKTTAHSMSNIQWYWVPATEQINANSRKIYETFSNYFKNRIKQDRVPYTPGAFKLHPDKWDGWAETSSEEGFKEILIDGAETIPNIGTDQNGQAPLAHICFKLRYSRSNLPTNNSVYYQKSQNIIQKIEQAVYGQDPGLENEPGLLEFISDLEENTVPIMPYYDPSVIDTDTRGGVTSSDLLDYINRPENNDKFKFHKQQIREFQSAINRYKQYMQWYAQASNSPEIQQTVNNLLIDIDRLYEDLPLVSPTTNRKETITMNRDDVDLVLQPSFLLRGIANAFRNKYRLNQEVLEQKINDLKTLRLSARGEVDPGTQQNIEKYYKDMYNRILDAYKKAFDSKKGSTNWFDRFLQNQPPKDILENIDDSRITDSITLVKIARDFAQGGTSLNQFQEDYSGNVHIRLFEIPGQNKAFPIIKKDYFYKLLQSFNKTYGQYTWSDPVLVKKSWIPEGYYVVNIPKGGLDINRISFEILEEYNKEFARTPEEHEAGMERAKKRSPQIKASYYSPNLTTEELQILALALNVYSGKGTEPEEYGENQFVIPNVPVYYYANGFDTLAVNKQLSDKINAMRKIILESGTIPEKVKNDVAANLPEIPKFIQMNAVPSIRKIPAPDGFPDNKRLTMNLDDGNLGRKHLLRYWNISDSGSKNRGLNKIFDKYVVTNWADRWFSALKKIDMSQFSDADVQAVFGSVISQNAQTNADNIQQTIRKYSNVPFSNDLSEEDQQNPELMGNGNIHANFIDSFVKPSMPGAIKTVNHFYKMIGNQQPEDFKVLSSRTRQPVAHFDTSLSGANLIYNQVDQIADNLQQQLNDDISNNWFLRHALGDNENQKNNLQIWFDEAKEEGYYHQIETLLEQVNKLEDEYQKQLEEYEKEYKQYQKNKKRNKNLEKPIKPSRSADLKNKKEQIGKLLAMGPGNVPSSPIESTNVPQLAYSNLSWEKTRQWKKVNDLFQRIPAEIFDKYTQDINGVAFRLVEMYKNGAFGEEDDSESLSGWDWLVKCLARLTKVNAGGKSLGTISLGTFGSQNHQLVSTGHAANDKSQITKDGFINWKKYGYQLSKIMDMISAISTRSCSETRHNGGTAYGVGYSTASGKAGEGEIMLGVRYAYRASDYKQYFVDPGNLEHDTTAHLDQYVKNIRRDLGKRHVRADDVMLARSQHYQKGDFLPDTLEYSKEAAERGGFVVLENVEYFVGIATSAKRFHKTLYHSMDFRDSLNYFFSHYGKAMEDAKVFIEPFNANLKSLYGHAKKAVSNARDEIVQEIKDKRPNVEVLYVGTIGGAEFLRDDNINYELDVANHQSDNTTQNWVQTNKDKPVEPQVLDNVDPDMKEPSPTEIPVQQDNTQVNPDKLVQNVPDNREPEEWINVEEAPQPQEESEPTEDLSFLDEEDTEEDSKPMNINPKNFIKIKKEKQSKNNKYIKTISCIEKLTKLADHLDDIGIKDISDGIDMLIKEVNDNL